MSQQTPPSGRSQARRAELVRQIADALLAEGVAQIPLRDLAARLGTSDRMLLYYFEDKADLVAASIEALAQRLDTVLGAGARLSRRPPAEVLRAMGGLLSEPGLRPFMSVWADILARGGRGEAPFQAIARTMVARSLASLETQLDMDEPGARRRTAAAILAAIEGAWLLGVAAPGSMDEVVDLFAGWLDAD